MDIHSHILPSVDDGAKDIDESIEMIKTAIDDGIEAVVATSHVLNNLNREIDELYRSRFDQLSERVQKENLPIKVFLGSEIMFQFGLKAAKDLGIATLDGNGRYFLIEVPMRSFPDQFEDAMFKMRAAGLTSILAHPERNAVLGNDEELVYRLANQGVLLQINASSLSPRARSRIREAAWNMITKGLVHFIATDAHDLASRPLILSRARDAVREELGEETAQRLFYENPWKAIRGERIKAEPTYRPQKQKKRGIFGNLWRNLVGTPD